MSSSDARAGDSTSAEDGCAEAPARAASSDEPISRTDSAAGKSQTAPSPGEVKLSDSVHGDTGEAMPSADVLPVAGVTAETVAVVVTQTVTEGVAPAMAEAGDQGGGGDVELGAVDDAPVVETAAGASGPVDASGGAAVPPSDVNRSPSEHPAMQEPIDVSTTDVTMATVDPAPLPADGDGSSCDTGREMAVSGALAMLAGYDSDGDGDSDAGDNTATAAADSAVVSVDREGLYRDSLATPRDFLATPRDSLATPCSGDSESDSADDSTDSTSSCSDSESEPAADVEDRDGDEEEDGEVDRARRVFGPMTRGELCLLDLPPIERLQISLPEDQCQTVGVVASVVDCLVVVQSAAGAPALDLDSVLFLERGRRPLGRVFDVMGPVASAAYCVRFNSPEEIAQLDIRPGAEVCYAPGSAEYSQFVFVEALRKMRGSDASWWDCNEPPEGCLDFSDDEEERSHKRQSRKRPGTSEAAESAEEAGPRPRAAARSERGRGRGRGGGPTACRPPWMPAPPRNPFYGHRGPSAGPPMRWHQPPPPPAGPFSRPPPPPPPSGGFGQPQPPSGGFGQPPSAGFGQPPPPFAPRPAFGLPPGGPPLNQPPPWSRPAFWGPR